MRRGLMVALLVGLLPVVAQVCVGGWPGAVTMCGSAHQVAHSSSAVSHAHTRCMPRFKNDQTRCRLRTFVQFHAVQLRTASLPQPIEARRDPVPPDGPWILTSSIGPPETDRGPPNS